MKNLIPILIAFIVCACNKNSQNDHIQINLEKTTDILNYSDFVDSLSYIHLNTNDSCLISGIRKLYLDGDTLIILDRRREGVFVFSLNGDFIKQIHYIGQGPEEYHSESSVTVNKNKNLISVYSTMDEKINHYTYQGDFITSYKMSNFNRDYEIHDDVVFMINPTKSLVVVEESGLWTTDLEYHYEKHLLTDAPEHEFTYLSRHCVNTDQNLFYYDTNKDYIYILTKDSAQLIYPLEIKQTLPAKKRISSDINMNELAGYAMLDDFCVSSDNLLLRYYIFKEGDNFNFRWVFMDRKDNSVNVYRDLIDNIDHTKSAQGEIFYLNDSIWARVIQTEDVNCDTILQLLHLKK